jgi:hypothetical protein
MRQPWSVMTVLFGALGGMLHAQPQAPIEWGAMRLLMQMPEEESFAQDVYPCGDTLVLHGGRRDSVTSQYYPALAVSGDNGNTWSPWAILGEPGELHHSGLAQVVFLNSGIYCCAETRRSRGGFYRSTDLGQSWQPPPTVLPVLHFKARRGDTLVCVSGVDSITWTADCGLTFAPLRDAGLGEWASAQDIGISNGWVHVVTCLLFDPYETRMRLRYARAPLVSGPFEPVQILNDNIFWSNAAHIEFDEDGWGMILTSVDYTPPAPSYEAILLNTSHDDGVTWSPPDTLTPVRSAGAYNEDIVRQGYLWLAYWWDSTRQAGFGDGGVWCRFSANRGRSWYPNQQVEGIGWEGGAVGHGEIHGHRTHVSVICYELDNVPGNYFLEWEGQIRRDSLSPLILPLVWPADTVTEGDTLVWAAQASDNDTLSEVRLRICSDVDSCWTVLLPISGADLFRTSWVVPDEGFYRYRFEAEDFWENVSIYPDSGWLSFVAERRSNVNDPFILHPSSFGVLVFPNPSNGWPRLELVPEWFQHGPVKVSLYNVMGQRVWASTLSTGSHTIPLAADVPCSSSGIYWVQVENRDRVEREKVLVTK